MRQGLIGTHIATDIPVEIPLNGKEMQLAMDKGPKLNESWRAMCFSVLSRTGITIEGAIDIDFIVVDGLRRSFH
jgi:hypothetical protein